MFTSTRNLKSRIEDKAVHSRIEDKAIGSRNPIKILETWDEIEQYILKPSITNNSTSSPGLCSITSNARSDKFIMTEETRNIFFNNEKLLSARTKNAAKAIKTYLTSKLNSCTFYFNASFSYTSITNTLRYLFFHIGQGLYIKIQGGEIVMFIPFSNRDYTNTFYDYIFFDKAKYESFDDYCIKRKRLCESVECSRNYNIVKVETDKSRDINSKNNINDASSDNKVYSDFRQWRSTSGVLNYSNIVDTCCSNLDFNSKFNNNSISNMSDSNSISNMSDSIFNKIDQPNHRPQALSFLLDMLDQVCKNREIPDVEFFINQQNSPQIKMNLTEPDDHMYMSYDNPLVREKYESYIPICSFVGGDRFADILVPCACDWFACVDFADNQFRDSGSSKNDKCIDTSDNKDTRDFIDDKNERDEKYIKGTRDIKDDKFIKGDKYTGNVKDTKCDRDDEDKQDIKASFENNKENNNKENKIKWSNKIPTCFFLGSINGAGVTSETNSRLHAAQLSIQWNKDSRYNSENKIDGVPYLDVRITDIDTRERKICGRAIDFFSSDLVTDILSSDSPHHLLSLKSCSSSTSVDNSTSSSMSVNNSTSSTSVNNSTSSSMSVNNSNQSTSIKSSSSLSSGKLSSVSNNSLSTSNKSLSTQSSLTEKIITNMGENKSSPRVVENKSSPIIKTNNNLCKYKYLLYISDQCTDSNYIHLMKSRSVIFKVETNKKYCLGSDRWYFCMLKPFSDHIPIKHDLSDLSEQITWAKNNDKECIKIAARAYQLADNILNKNTIMDYWQYLLCEIYKRNNLKGSLKNGDVKDRDKKSVKSKRGDIIKMKKMQDRIMTINFLKDNWKASKLFHPNL